MTTGLLPVREDRVDRESLIVSDQKEIHGIYTVRGLKQNSID